MNMKRNVLVSFAVLQFAKLLNKGVKQCLVFPVCIPQQTGQGQEVNQPLGRTFIGKISHNLPAVTFTGIHRRIRFFTMLKKRNHLICRFVPCSKKEGPKPPKSQSV